MLSKVYHILIFHRVFRVKKDLALNDGSFLEGPKAALYIMIATVRNVWVKHGVACRMRQITIQADIEGDPLGFWKDQVTERHTELP
jgi:hypothetical protein